jgi:virginiamycin A acetyltransferase
VYQFFAQFLASVPGYPGVVVRRGYYWWTLEQSSLRVYVGYGAYFAHRASRVADHVYVGPYAVIGSADIGRWVMIGTRASLLSGGALHAPDDKGRWLPSNFDTTVRIRIGAHSWLGEGAIIMSDVGSRAMVAAGAVVSSPVADGVMVAGNPARFVRHVTHPTEAGV